MKIAIVGAGRAGTSFATALSDVGHEVRLLHHDELERVGERTSCMLCVPDDAITAVAEGLEPCRVAPLSTSPVRRDFGDLAKHPRVGFPASTRRGAVIGRGRRDSFARRALQRGRRRRG